MRVSVLDIRKSVEGRAGVGDFGGRCLVGEGVIGVDFREIYVIVLGVRYIRVNEVFWRVVRGEVVIIIYLGKFELKYEKWDEEVGRKWVYFGVGLRV